MSLEKAARHLAAKGRKGDSQLVHMTSGEVAGLQALAKKHGTSLTINPKTGLPEAFSLKSILPMIASGVAGFYSGGNPYAAGAAGAATSKLLGGSDRAALMSGVGGAFGAGAFGGAASDVSALGTAGTAEAEMPFVVDGMDMPPLPQEAPTMAELPQGAYSTENVGGGGPAPDNVAAAPSSASPEPLTTGEKWDAFQQKMDDRGGMGKAGLGALAQYSAVDPEKPTPKKLEQHLRPYSVGIHRGAPNSADSREQQQVSYDFTPGPVQDVSTYAAQGGLMKLAAGGSTTKASTTGGYKPEQVYGAGKSGAYDPSMIYGAGATPPNMGPPQAGTTGPADAQSGAPTRMYIYDPKTAGFTKNPNWLDPKIAENAAALAEYNRVDHNGVMGGWEDKINSSGYVPKPLQQSVFNDGFKGLPGVQGIGNPFSFAEGGGITALNGGGHLGGYSDGGQLLRGPGDGVSDSIPGSINGKQPARLADGEFVVPARHVSELGNGSTEAGSRKLYGMLDRIQKARRKTVGKGKGSVDSKADKFLPA